MSDLIGRKDVLHIIKKYFNENYIIDGAWYADELIRELSDLPSAQPEIIYCKDCKKHNMPKGHYYNGKYIGVKECCPLVLVRGLAQGHEFDYQYCAWAERRTDETD